MSRKTITQEKSISDEEIDAQNAENRKNTAEGEFVILTDNIKRLKNELENINKNIDDSKLILDDINLKIISSKKVYSDIQDNIKTEQLFLDTVKDELKEAENNKVDFYKLKIIKEKEFNDKVIELENKYKTKEDELNNNLLFKEQDFKNLTTKIDNCNLYLNDLDITKNNKLIELSKIQDNIVDSNNFLSSKNNEIIELDKRINNQNTLIETKKNIIELLKNDISDKETILNNLNISIENKTKEYKSMETKVFNFVKREEELNQKEEFIKNRYQLAGIEY